MIIFLYSLIAYLIGFTGLAMFILFLGSWEFLPLHINSKTPDQDLSAWLINISLMSLFALQHSVMARTRFKQWLTGFVPVAAERSTYVLLSGVALLILCFYWQPISGHLWHVDSGWLHTLLLGGYIFGWLFSLWATFLINHFELMGLQQAYRHLHHTPTPAVEFTERGLYTLVRHPIQLGALMGVWFTPQMSVTHFCLALTLTLYIFIGLHFEEKSLVTSLGDRYRDYQQRVPMLIPFIGKARPDH